MKTNLNEDLSGARLLSLVLKVWLPVTPQLRQPWLGNRSGHLRMNLNDTRPFALFCSRLRCAYLQPWIKMLLSPFYLFNKTY